MCVCLLMGGGGGGCNRQPKSLAIHIPQARAKHGSGDCLDAEGVCSDVREGRARVCQNSQPVVRAAIAASAFGVDRTNERVRVAVLACAAGVMRKALAAAPQRRGTPLASALLLLLREGGGGGPGESALLEALLVDEGGAGAAAMAKDHETESWRSGEAPAAPEAGEAIAPPLLRTAHTTAPTQLPKATATAATVHIGTVISSRSVSASAFLLTALSDAEWGVLRARGAVSRDGRVLDAARLSLSEEAHFDRHRLQICVDLGVVSREEACQSR